MLRAISGFARVQRPWRKKVARIPAAASASRIRPSAPGRRRPTRELRVESERDPHYCASVTFVRPSGLVGVEALRASASAAAKSWPGTTESSGASSGSGGSGTGSAYAAPSISDAALPLATSVAPAARGPPAASTTAGRRLVARRDRPDGEQRVECGDRPVREVGRGQRLGGDAARLGQLQRDLARSRELDARGRSRTCGRRRRTRVATASTARSSRGRASSSRLARPLAAPRRSPPPRPATAPASSDSAAIWFDVRLRRRDCVLGARGERQRRVRGRARAREPSSFVTATVNAPRARARVTYATTSGVRPDCESADDDRARQVELARRSRRDSEIESRSAVQAGRSPNA